MRDIDLAAERSFENSKVRNGDVRASQKKYYWATELPIRRFEEQTIETIRGKRVLEIGCSSGKNAEMYAAACAHYTGVDISDEGIRAARLLELDNTDFQTCDAHSLPFADESFDAVIVNGLLHHLDLRRALPEIHRVLTVDGVLCAREPLGTNLLFNAYRAITPSARTRDERPFSFSDLKVMQQYFPYQSTTFFGFLSIASAIARSEGVRSLLTSIDSAISRTPIKYGFWQFCGFYRKQPERPHAA